MGIENLQNIRLYTNARNKVIYEFFQGEEINEEVISNKDLSVHAAALSMYTAILASQVFELNSSKINVESNEREIALQNYIKSETKYKSLTEEQVKEKAHQTILREIRNSFAHGNFTISYDKAKNELYFLLNPKHAKHGIDTPIIISADSIKDVIMDSCFGYLFSDDNSMESKINNDLSNLIKKSLIPTQMLKIYDYYLGKSLLPLKISPKRYLLIQHALLAAQITYEQDDYYNIFGKDSNIFEVISLIRNSVVHNFFVFEEYGKNVTYTDRNRVLNEHLNDNVTYLASAIELKNIILSASNNNHSKEAILELKEKLTEVLQLYFNNMNKVNIIDDGCLN